MESNLTEVGIQSCTNPDSAIILTDNQFQKHNRRFLFRTERYAPAQDFSILESQAMSYLLRYAPNSYGLYLTSSKTADADAAKFAMIGYENTIGLINQSNTIFEILKPNMTDAKSDEMEYFLTNLNTIIDSKSDNPQEFSRIVSAIENDLNESNNIRMQSTTSTVDPSLRVYCDNIDILLNNVIPYIQNGDYLAADKKYILYILDNYEYLKTQIEEVNSTLMLQIYRNKYERKSACFNQKSNLTSCCH